MDHSGIPGEIPIIALKNSMEGSKAAGVYSFNYFKFPEEFNQYLSNKKEKFTYTDEYFNFSYVESLNATDFTRKIFDSSFREFILEIKHEGCPTCFMLGKMHDHLSQKTKKHGLSKKLRHFRIDTENDIPLFGKFSATPTYLFVRKNKENTELELVVPLEKNDFLFSIKKYSRLNLDKIKYHPNLMYGFFIYQKREFAEKGFDPDVDVRVFDI